MPDTVEGMRVVWVPSDQALLGGKMQRHALRFNRALKLDTPDMMHLHSVVAGSLAPLLRMRRIPCVLQMHGIEWMRSRWGGVAKTLLKTMERRSMRSADMITAVSQTQCSHYRDAYGINCEFIPTAAEVKKLAPAELITQMGLRRESTFCSRHA